MKTIDMHCDTISRLLLKEYRGEAISFTENDLMLDIHKMEQGDYLLQNFALFIPLSHLPEGTGPFTYGMKMLDVFYRMMEENGESIQPVSCYQDIEDNMKKGKMSALLTLEEGQICEGDLRLLRDFYRLGARMMTLTWNFPNELAYPAKTPAGYQNGADYNTPEYGLTEKGIAFVQEMERLGMIVDVSHLNDAGIRDVLRYTTKPLVASHSNARALCSHPRNLPDDLILAIADRGGVIGINYFGAFLKDTAEGETPQSRIQDMIRHIKYIRNLAGIDCIGLGSDFDGISGNLEMASAAEVPKLEAALRENGFTEEEIEKIFYRNVLRVYKEVLH